MNQVLRRLSAPFRVRHQYNNTLDQQRARGLLLMSWAIFIISVLALLYEISLTNPARGLTHIVFLDLDPEGIVFGLIFIISLLNLVTASYSLNRGALASAGVIYILSLFIIVLLAYIPNGTISFGMFGFSMPLIAAGWLMNRSGLLTVIGLVALALLISGVMSAFGLLANVTFGPLTATDGMLFGILISLADGGMLLLLNSGSQLILKRNQTLLSERRSLTVFSRIVSNASNLDRELSDAVETIRDQLGYYHVQIFLIEEQTRLVVLRAVTGALQAQGDVAPRRFSLDEKTIINEVLRDGVTQHIVQSDPPIRRREFLPQTKAELIVPLRRGERVLGVLDMQSIRADAFRAADVELSETIAAQIAIMLQNIRLLNDLQEANQERLQQALQLQTLTTQFNQLNQEIRGRTWESYFQHAEGRTLGFDWRQGLLTTNRTLSPQLAHILTISAPELKIQDNEQVLSVPIMLRGEIFGVMEFRAPRDKAWTERQVNLTRTIAQRLALALENIRLFEQAEITAAREKVANQVAASLQSRTEMDTLLAAAATAFQQALGASRTSIRLSTPTDQKFEPARTANSGKSNNGGEA